MLKATKRRSPRRPRRLPRSRASSQPHPQQFLLRCSIAAAVLALVLAFRLGDAESMRAHHHDAGQGHARPSKRRDTAAGGREQQPFSIGSAAAEAAASRLTCTDSRQSRRVADYLSSSSGGDGGGIHPFARTANFGAPGRGATTRPATTAFVASSSVWPAAGAICSTRRGHDDAASGASSMMSMTRRHSRHAAQPTQEHHQPWLQDRFAGLVRPQHSRGGSSRGGRSSWRSDFHDTTALHSSREQHAGRHSFHSPPESWYVASGSGSGSNNLAPYMDAGGGKAGGGGGLIRPPLLITIGPQCAGKTSLLRALAANSEAARQREGTGSSGSGASSGKSGVPSVTDVTIDDHPSVYHKVPTGVLLDGCDRGSRGDTLIGRRLLSDRLCDPGCVETRLVAQRLVGGISAEEFADRLKGYGGQASPAALATLCAAVEAAVSEEIGVSTPTVDVFVRENLFPEAISSSQDRLALAARTEDGLVAWGNTNTQARDYRGALEQAELTGRPVRFLRWGYELPVLSLEELSRRNVCRFAATGRYVEVAAVESALCRVDKLYASTFGGDPASLALAAGFEMDAAGRVRSQSRRRNPPRSRGGIGSGGGGGGGGGGMREARRGTAGLPEGGNAVALSGGGGGRGGGSVTMPPGTLSRDSYPRVENNAAWGDSRSSISSSSWSTRPGLDGGDGGRTRAPPPPPPSPPPRPLPVGPVDRLAFDGPQRRRYGHTASAVAPQGLAQEWAPRGGNGGARAALTGAGSSRRWHHHHSGAGGATTATSAGSASVPPTVMFGNEWGRKRAWRRTGYTDDDIDPTLSSCFFRKPANSTGELRRNDLGEGSGPDLEEMELVRRIRSFRQRR